MVKPSMKHVNDVNEVSNQKCVSIFRRWIKCGKKNLEKGDDTQNKAMRRWNE